MVTRDTAWADGTPCWTDLMTSDVEAARAFYAELFGWHFEVGGAETGFYAMASVNGKSVAGVGQLQMDHPPVWTTYLAAADADAAADAVVRHGGTVVAPVMDVMEHGRMAIVQDPGKGTFGIWQAKQHTGFELANEDGAVIWNELMTRDYDGAKEFYAGVFSYTFTEIGENGFQYSMLNVNGDTVGGLGLMPAEVPAEVPTHWRVYFSVPDADAAAERAQSLGGTIIRPPNDMPYGRQVDLADPQGAMFSVIKPQPMQQ